MLIRSATFADLSAVIALERSAPNAAHWSKQQYEIALGRPERVFSVAEEDSLLSGLIVARVIAQEWEIENIVVAAAQHRRGVGTALLADIVRRAHEQKADSIFLEVRESNVAARSFYEKNGFVQAGQRRHYYQNPQEDALLYRRAVR